MEKENIIKIMNAKQFVGLIAVIAQSPYFNDLRTKEGRTPLDTAIALTLLVMNQIKNKDTELSYDRFVFLDNYKKNEGEVKEEIGYYNNPIVVENVNKVINALNDDNYTVKQISQSDGLNLEIEWLNKYFSDNLTTTYYSEHASRLRGPQSSYLTDSRGNRRDKYL